MSQTPMPHPRRALTLAAAALAAPLSAGACSEVEITDPAHDEPQDPLTLEFAPSLNVDIADFTEVEDGLWVREVEQGVGEDSVEVGDVVGFDVAAWLADGRLIQPLVGIEDYTVGDENLIAGVRLGLEGMRVGEGRVLLVEPHLAYGAETLRQGRLTIPGNSVIVFELHLEALAKAGETDDSTTTTTGPLQAARLPRSLLGG